MTEDEYVEIGITILESAPHRARVKVSMTITRLIDEILKEFDDMDRSDPGRYALFLGGGDKPLPHQATLAKLDICNQDELAFRYLQVSRRRNLPVDKILSLQDDQGQTYDINWQPAVIGRPTIDPDHNQMLAVNLQSHPNGNHISRQHAQITFNKDHFYIEPLNENNPVTLNNELSPIQTPRELAVGDRIVLGKGRVVLKVLTPVSRKQQVDDSSGTQVSAMAAGGSTYLSGPPPRARITFVSSDASPVPFEIASFPYFVGREMVESRLEDTAVSRKHAKIDFDQTIGIFTLTDLSSRNGVFINGDRIMADRAVPLPDQAVVGLGQKSKFKFEVI